MQGDQTRPTVTGSRWTFGLPALLAATVLIGVGFGAAAQLLTSSGPALQALGMSTAPWVTVGFVFASIVARRWTGRDRAPWMCVLVALYLYGWLLAYHCLYALIENVPAATVWAESRLWVAAVAPACLALGYVAVGSLRSGVVGDVCLAAPLAWSLPEAVGAAYTGWSQALLMTAPLLLVAAAPLVITRDRRWNPTIIVITALLGEAALMVVSAPVMRVLNSAG